MTGTAGAQIISALAAPILTRIYEPSSFGVLAVYTSVVGIVTSFATLRYDQALMLPDNVEESSNLMIGACLIVTLVAGISAMFFFVVGKNLVALLKTPNLYPLILIAPLSIFFIGINQTLTSWSAKRKEFGRSPIAQITRAVNANIAQILIGIKNSNPVGLISGFAFGDLVACFTLGYQVVKQDKSSLFRSYKIRDIFKTARAYIDFPIYSSSQNLLNAISQNIPLVLLAFFYDAAVVGFYSLAIRILQIPINLILFSFRQVLFQKATEVKIAGGNTFHLFKRTTFGLIAVVILPSVFIFFYAPTLFEVILGKEWHTSGEYARWIVVWLSIGFINPPSIIFAQIYRKQRLLFVWNFWMLLCRILAIVIGGSYFSPLQTVIFYSSVGFIFNSFIVFYIYCNFSSLSAPSNL